MFEEPRASGRRPRVRLRGYQPLFGVNYYCLTRYVPLHLNGLTHVMYLGGENQSTNIYQHPRCARMLAESLGFLFHTALGVSECRDWV